MPAFSAPANMTYLNTYILLIFICTFTCTLLFFICTEFLPDWCMYDLSSMCRQTQFYWSFIITNVAMERFDSFINSLVFHWHTGMNRASYLYEFKSTSFWISSQLDSVRSSVWTNCSWFNKMSLVMNTSEHNLQVNSSSNGMFSVLTDFSWFNSIKKL